MRYSHEVLDGLANCAEVCFEDFDAQIKRQEILLDDGTIDFSLLITTGTGDRFRVVCEKLESE